MVKDFLLSLKETTLPTIVNKNAFLINMSAVAPPTQAPPTQAPPTQAPATQEIDESSSIISGNSSSTMLGFMFGN